MAKPTLRLVRTKSDQESNQADTSELIDFLNGLSSVKNIRLISSDEQDELDLSKESPALRRSIIRARNTK